MVYQIFVQSWVQPETEILNNADCDKRIIPVLDDGWVWSAGGIIIDKENQSCFRRFGHSDTLFTTNPMWTAV
jgi:hypothetical protein